MDCKFYEYSQNNSGGSFVVDSELCHRLIIEAANEVEANQIAESKGVYFDGVSEGRDCSCCGDRWYRPSELTLPIDWGNNEKMNTIEEYCQVLADNYGWTFPETRLFRKDGRIQEFFTRPKNK